MSEGTKFAIALVLFWLAGLALFVAFHPNGLKNADGSPVENFAQIIAWWIDKIGSPIKRKPKDQSTP